MKKNILKIFLTLLTIVPVLGSGKEIIEIKNDALNKDFYFHDVFNAKNCDEIIEVDKSRVCYSYKYKAPLFVSYDISGHDYTRGNFEPFDMYEETKIRKEFRRTHKDFKDENYAYARIIPLMHNRRSNENQFKFTSSIVNIVPLNKSVKQKQWDKFEAKLNRLHKRANWETLKNFPVTMLVKLNYSLESKKLDSGVTVPDSISFKMHHTLPTRVNECYQIVNSSSSNKYITDKKCKRF